MQPLATDAIKLAILNHPQTFGLNASQVNPMLLFIQRQIDLGDELADGEVWEQCFNAVQETLHEKTVEVLGNLATLRAELQEQAISAEAPEPPKVEPTAKAEPEAKAKGNSKPGGNGKVIGSPGRELSTKQLRYLGYLIRQTGAEPDYTEISRLSQQQATLRIKELEKQVKGVAAVG